MSLDRFGCLGLLILEALRCLVSHEVYILFIVRGSHIFLPLLLMSVLPPQIVLNN